MTTPQLRTAGDIQCSCDSQHTVYGSSNFLWSKNFVIACGDETQAIQNFCEKIFVIGCLFTKYCATKIWSYTIARFSLLTAVTVPVSMLCQLLGSIPTCVHLNCILCATFPHQRTNIFFEQINVVLQQFYSMQPLNVSVLRPSSVTILFPHHFLLRVFVLASTVDGEIFVVV